MNNEHNCEKLEENLQFPESPEEMLPHELTALKHSHTILTDLIGQANLAYIELNSQLQVIEWSSGAERLLGYSEDNICGHLLSAFIAVDEEKEELSDFLSNALISSNSQSQTFKNVNSLGEEISCEWYCTSVRHTHSAPSGIAIVIKDITPVIMARKHLKYVKKNFKEMFESAPIGIYQADSDKRIIAANPELAWMLGYESAESLTEQMNDTVAHMFADQEKAEEFFFRLYEAEQLNRFKTRLQRKDGSTFWALSYAQITRNDADRMNGFYGFSVDITSTVRAEKALKQVNEELKLLSILDGLTKIPNRRRFDEYLAHQWKRLFRDQQPLSMILCDIDFFKLYNDTYGHQTGDECLRNVAQTIMKCANRPCDLTARYGGEEFALILPNTEVEGAIHVAEKIRAAVRNLEIPHSSSRVDTCVTLSLGVFGMVPNPEASPEDIIAMADKALYQAKEHGRNRYCCAAEELTIGL